LVSFLDRAPSVLLDREAEASEMRMVKEARIGVRYRDHVTRPAATNQERGERREEEKRRRAESRRGVFGAASSREKATPRSLC
jgi:hypothetical protein